MVPETPELDTDTVRVDVPEPPVTGFVLKLADTPAGVVADINTLSVKPLIAVMVITDVSEPSGGIESDDGEAWCRDDYCGSLCVADWGTYANSIHGHHVGSRGSRSHAERCGARMDCKIAQATSWGCDAP